MYKVTSELILEEAIERTMEIAEMDKDIPVTICPKTSKFETNYTKEILFNDYVVSDFAMQQLSQIIKVPYRYINTLREKGTFYAMDVLLTALNHGITEFADNKDSVLKTRGGVLRGVVSPKYTPYTNVDVLRNVAKNISPHSGYSIKMMQESDRIFNLRLTFPSLSREMAVGDIVEVGIDISNSEVGYCSVNMMPLIYRLVCTNGMRTNDAIGDFRKRHVGITYDKMNEFFDGVFSNDLSVMASYADKMKELIGIPVENIGETIPMLSKKLEFTNKISNKVIEQINSISCEKNSSWIDRYDVLNGFTATAKALPLHERLQMETSCAKLIKLTDDEWTVKVD